MFKVRRGAYQKACELAKNHLKTDQTLSAEVEKDLRDALVALCLEIVASTCGRDPGDQAERFRALHDSLIKRNLTSVWIAAMAEIKTTLEGRRNDPTGHALGLGVFALYVDKLRKKKKRQEADRATPGSISDKPSADGSVEPVDDSDNGSFYSASSQPFSENQKDVNSSREFDASDIQTQGGL
jgi:hypothetical protein